jgi:hypothetical protein
MASKQQRKTIDTVFIMLGAVAVVVLLVAGCLAWWGYSFADKSVKDELSAQKIYFPAKGSPALDPSEFPTLQKYAGQLVDNGPKAKAYANDFIGKHLENVAGGKTYSEVSAEAKADPTNATLQQQKQTLFQGETLRGILLGDGYAYWTFGQIAYYAALAAFAGAAVMAVLVVLGMNHLRRLK